VSDKCSDIVFLSSYIKSLSNSPNPPAPFPEREGGDIITTPLSRHHHYSPLLSGEGPGEGCFDSESVLYLQKGKNFKIKISTEVSL